MRCLIIGCGCRGRLLASELRRQGHAVRGTSRDPSRLPEIEAAGAEAVLGDPDRVATLMQGLENVAVVCVLLGSATGGPEQLAALHTTRLEMLLSKVVDTAVRGVVYEARGRVDPELLAGGARRVRAFGERSLVRTALLEAEPEPSHDWARAAVEAVARAIASPAPVAGAIDSATAK